MDAPVRAGMVVLPIAIAAAMLGGCGGAVQYMEVRDDLRIYRESHPLVAASPSPANATHSIAVVTTKNLSASFSGNALPLAFNLLPSEGDRAPRSLTFGFFIKGGGEVIATALADHVGAERPGWSASLVTGAAGATSADVTVTPVRIELTGKGAFVHAMRVTLLVETKDGRRFNAFGMSDRESTAGHLGWAIPAIVLTGFTGLLFVSPTMQAVNNGVDERQYAVAVDRACVDVLRQIDTPALARAQ